MTKQVAILFARRDSIYKKYEYADVYDIDRDARIYTGSLPVIAHPPCRAWGRLRHFAKPRPDEKDLALFAIDQVRRCGGILEHPAASSLWKEESRNLPIGNQIDEFGGFTIKVHQFWWGHKAEKKTYLYINGIERSMMLPYPLKFDAITHVVTNGGKMKHPRRPEISKKAREATPILFAEWLMKLAAMCKKTELV